MPKIITQKVDKSCHEKTFYKLVNKRNLKCVELKGIVEKEKQFA